MRKLPSLWPGVERIQYLCVFLESINLSSLRSVPLITSGFQSLLTTDLLSGHAQELFNVLTSKVRWDYLGSQKCLSLKI
ncbi:hypothetical protein [Desulfonema magnum]|uniref:Uncharacterized protein n=1 Tax=Desulfonema magnum TaxID=45655 RepID=A0A975GKB0_9BACT|nr:hypothetical protein [Desulfonema magnum]QTA84432.1 Uncharacterized protein dnm_004280 [Desulfonema magnum]